MKKTINVILFLMLSLILLTTTVLAENITASMSPSSNSVKTGDTFTVSINLSNSEGLNSGKGTITYSSDVLTLESISAGDSTAWSQPTKEDNGNGQATFTIARNSYDVSGNKIVTLTFKVKENVTVEQTVISVSNFTVSNSNYEDVDVPDANVTVKITNANAGTGNDTGNNGQGGNTATVDPSGVVDTNSVADPNSSGNTQTPSNTNTNQNANTNQNVNTSNNKNTNTNLNQNKNTAKGKLPQTGLNSILPILIIAVIAIGIGTYASYRKYKNM